MNYVMFTLSRCDVSAMLSQLQDMDLQLLRTFVTIVDNGGFSAAQGKLGMAQSTISTKMTKLEIRLNVRLCDRGRSGFRLTPKGEKVYQSAIKLLDAIGTFTRETQAVSETLVGKVHVGLSEQLAPQIIERIAEVIGRYRKHAQEVTIEMSAATPDELESKLLNNQIQLAIGYFSKSLSSLSYKLLFKERQALYCGKNHPLFEKSKINREDVSQAEKISHIYRIDSLGSRFVSERKTAISEQVEADLIFTLSGAYIGFLPEHIAKSWVSKRVLRPLLHNELSYDVDFYMATNNKCDISDPASLLKKYLSDEFDPQAHLS